MPTQNLGRIVMTRSVSDLTETNVEFEQFVSTCIARYRARKWGDLPKEDKDMNDWAVKSGEDRILASYNFPPNAPWRAVNGYGGSEDKLWIITEWDRSATTILFPGDY